MLGNPFRRQTDGSILWRAMTFELGLLQSLSQQIIELVEPPTWSDDPLERLANEQVASTLDRDDPAIARLFPEAYADDPDASSEYRRLMEADQRSAKAADAQQVLEALAAADREDPKILVAPGTEMAWLRTMNAIRLTLGARLGIESEADAAAIEELDEGDPRAPIADVYQWLAYVQSCLLDVL